MILALAPSIDIDNRLGNHYDRDILSSMFVSEDIKIAWSRDMTIPGRARQAVDEILSALKAESNLTKEKIAELIYEDLEKYEIDTLPERVYFEKLLWRSEESRKTLAELDFEDNNSLSDSQEALESLLSVNPIVGNLLYAQWLSWTMQSIHPYTSDKVLWDLYSEVQGPFGVGFALIMKGGSLAASAIALEQAIEQGDEWAIAKASFYTAYSVYSLAQTGVRIVLTSAAKASGLAIASPFSVADLAAGFATKTYVAALQKAGVSSSVTKGLAAFGIASVAISVAATAVGVGFATKDLVDSLNSSNLDKHEKDIAVVDYTLGIISSTLSVVAAIAFLAGGPVGLGVGAALYGVVALIELGRFLITIIDPLVNHTNFVNSWEDSDQTIIGDDITADRWSLYTGRDSIYLAGNGNDVIMVKGGDDDVYAGPGDDIISLGKNGQASSGVTEWDERVAPGVDKADGGPGVDTITYQADPDDAGGVSREWYYKFSWYGPGPGSTKKRWQTTVKIAESSQDNRFGIQVDLQVKNAQGWVEVKKFGPFPNYLKKYYNTQDEINARVVDWIKNIENVLGTNLNDEIKGDHLDNVLAGYGGSDFIQGRGGHDKLYGGSGNDELDGGVGNDVLHGGAGNDKLLGRSGNDVLMPGSLDTINSSSGITVDGGVGTDTVVYKDVAQGIDLSLMTGNVYRRTSDGSTDGLVDKLASIESVIGSGHADKITGTNSNDVLSGGGGADLIYGKKGNDVFILEMLDPINSFSVTPSITKQYSPLGAQLLDGGEGFDVVSYQHATLTDDNNPDSSNAVQGHWAAGLTAVGVHVSLLEGKGYTKYIYDYMDPSFDMYTFLGDLSKYRYPISTTLREILYEYTNAVGDPITSNIRYADHRPDNTFPFQIKDKTKFTKIFNALDRDQYNPKLPSFLKFHSDNHYYKNNAVNTFVSVEGIMGSEYWDTLAGDNNNNIIFGLSGDDHLIGHGGSDMLAGGKGNNVIDGGEGMDTVYFSEQWRTKGKFIDLDLRISVALIYEDAFKLYAERNLLESWIKDKWKKITAPDETTWYFESQGGLKDTEAVVESSMFDILSSIENVVGTQLADKIMGTDGRNVLKGGLGDDKLYGRGGDDMLDGNQGNDRLDGGAGNDTVTYVDNSELKLGVHINLAKGATERYVRSSDGSKLTFEDTLISIENAIGSNFNDLIIGTQANNILNGAAGDDVIHGGGGRDHLHGGGGIDDLHGGEDIDTYHLSLENNDQTIIMDFEAGERITGRHKHGLRIESIEWGTRNSNTLKPGSSGYLRSSEYLSILFSNEAKILVHYNQLLPNFFNIDKNTFKQNVLQSIRFESTEELTDQKDVFDQSNLDFVVDSMILAKGGNDSIHAGRGNDVVAGGSGSDKLNGGEGFDVLSYLLDENDSRYAAAFDFENMNVQFVGSPGVEDTFSNFEAFIGTPHDDTFTLGSDFIGGLLDHEQGRIAYLTDSTQAKVHLILDGKAGIDTVDFASVDLKAPTSSEKNYLTLDLEDSVGAIQMYEANKNNPTDEKFYFYIFNVENIVGSNFSDRIAGDALFNNRFQLNEGDDTAILRGAADYVDGGKGFDTVDFRFYLHKVNVDLSSDKFTYVNHSGTEVSGTLINVEKVIGSAFDDVIHGGGGRDHLHGGGGIDDLHGGEDIDTYHLSLENNDQTIIMDFEAGERITGRYKHGLRIESIDWGTRNSNTLKPGSSGHLRSSEYLSILFSNKAKILVHYNQLLPNFFNIDKNTFKQNVLQSIRFESTEELTDQKDVFDQSNLDFKFDVDSMILAKGGNDSIHAGHGNDIVSGGSGSDKLNGGEGYDVLSYLLDENDSRYAAAFDFKSMDVQFVGNPGVVDTFSNFEAFIGTPHDDTFTLGSDFIGGLLDHEQGRIAYLTDSTQAKVHLILDGKAGIDTVDFASVDLKAPTSSEKNYLTLDLENFVGAIQMYEANNPTDEKFYFYILNVENIIGSNFSDRITGDALFNNRFQLNEGDDTAILRGAADYVDGGKGFDTVDFRFYLHKVNVDLSSDKFTYVNRSGTEVSGTLLNVEKVVGSEFDDVIRAAHVRNQVLMGQDGNDTLLGGRGYDVLDGGEGIDTVDYSLDDWRSSGMEVVLGENSGDDGWSENDLDVIGSVVEDVLRSVEIVVGTRFEDLFWGSEEADRLEGRGGHDFLFGEGGNDTLSGGRGVDLLEGGEGIDTVDYSLEDWRTEGVTVQLGAGYEIGWTLSEEGDDDILLAIENVIGTRFADDIRGSIESNEIEGRGGNDTLSPGLSGNRLDGGEGIDTLDYSREDWRTGGVEVNLEFGFSGSYDGVGDLLEVSDLHSIENVIGTRFADDIRGSIEGNEIEGRGGNDKLYGNDGTDKLYGGEGVDELFGGRGGDELYGGEDSDTLYGGEDSDILYGGRNSDKLYGGEGDDKLFGGWGDDELFGGQGSDVFVFDTTYKTRGQVDVITDFESGVDSIEFQMNGVERLKSWEDVLSNSIVKDGDTIISYDKDFGSSVILKNVLINDLHADDFLFI